MDPIESGPKASYVLPETTAIVAVGCFDLLSTVYFVATKQAVEANPLFASILRGYGPVGFVTMKALLLGVPLIIAEWARRKSPRFVRNALRVCLAAYVGMLLLAYLQLAFRGPAPALHN